MGKYLGRHELCTLGKSTKLAFEASPTNNRLQLVSSEATADLPVMFLVYTTANVRLRQGTSAVVATVNDFLLKKDNYIKITVLGADSSYIAAIDQANGAGGTIICTEITNATPETGTSS